VPEPETDRSPQAIFRLAIQHHKAGRLRQAEQAYLQVADKHPNHADTIHMLGVIAHQKGNHAKAVDLIERAIALNGGNAAYYSNLGVALRSLNRLPEAAEKLRQAVRVDPDYPAARKNLGVTLREMSCPEQAEEHLRAAVKMAPDDAGNCKGLGALLMDMGKAAEAAELFARAARLAPQDAEVQNNLGVALNEMGRLEESAQALRKAISMDSSKAEAYNNLGLTLSAQGQYDDAVAQYRQAIELSSDFALAHSNLGVVLKEQGKLDESLASFNRALELDPNHVAARNNLGDALNCLGRHDQAIKQLAKAIELDPNCFEAHNNMGLALNNLDRPAEATRYLEQSLQLNGNYVPAQINLGNALVSRGNVEEGAAHYLQALELQADCVPAYYSLAINSRKSFSDEELRQTESLLSRRKQSDEDRMLLSFTLAQVLAKKGLHKEAFEHCRRANDLRKSDFLKRGVRFDIDKHASLVDETISTFTSGFFEQTKGSGIETELPIFVVGMPRSGTTLIEQIVSSHHAIHGAGELPDIEYMVADLPTTIASRADYPRCLQDAPVEKLRQLAERHLRKLAQLGGKVARVVDKMTVNFLHLGLIATLFPKARVIHCMRDPRDICVSCYFHNFARAGLCFAFDLDHLGAFYSQYERLMSHWRKVLPLRMMEVQYEQMVYQQEPMTRKLIEFCGLQWDPNCLAFHKNDRPVKTASALQVRQPIYSTSIARWRNYQEQLKPFTAWLESPRSEL